MLVTSVQYSHLTGQEHFCVTVTVGLKDICPLFIPLCVGILSCYPYVTYHIGISSCGILKVEVFTTLFRVLLLYLLPFVR
jgi:hypothetical protein